MFKFKRSLEQKAGVTLKVYFITFPAPQSWDVSDNDLKQ